MGKHIGPDTTHPQIAGFIATLKTDKELSGLSTTYEAAFAVLEDRLGLREKAPVVRPHSS